MVLDRLEEETTPQTQMQAPRSEPHSPLLDLPSECWNQIVLYLKMDEVKNLRLCSKWFNNLASERVRVIGPRGEVETLFKNDVILNSVRISEKSSLILSSISNILKRDRRKLKVKHLRLAAHSNRIGKRFSHQIDYRCLRNLHVELKDCSDIVNTAAMEAKHLEKLSLRFKLQGKNSIKTTTTTTTTSTSTMIKTQILIGVATLYDSFFSNFKHLSTVQLTNEGWPQRPMYFNVTLSNLSIGNLMLKGFIVDGLPDCVKYLIMTWCKIDNANKRTDCRPDVVQLNHVDGCHVMDPFPSDFLSRASRVSFDHAFDGNVWRREEPIDKLGLFGSFPNIFAPRVNEISMGQEYCQVDLVKEILQRFQPATLSIPNFFVPTFLQHDMSRAFNETTLSIAGRIDHCMAIKFIEKYHEGFKTLTINLHRFAVVEYIARGIVAKFNKVRVVY